MKFRYMPSIIGLFAVAPFLSAAYGPIESMSEQEFFGYGDFNSSGRQDFVVVDRASGVFRIAYANLNGDLQMQAPLPSGIPDVTDIAIGKYQGSFVDGIALTSPLQNRANLIRSVGGIPNAVYFAGVGPQYITAVDLPGGFSGRDDLVGVTLFNNPELSSLMIGHPYIIEFLLNGLDFSHLKQHGLLFRPVNPLRMEVEDGLPSLYGVFLSINAGESSNFLVYDTTLATIPLLTGVVGLPTDSYAVYGSFHAAHRRSSFIFHVPGSADMQMSELTSGYEMQPAVSHNLDQAAERLRVIHSKGVFYLASILVGGNSVRLYVYDEAAQSWSFAQALNAPHGLRFTGLFPSLAGGMMALVGDPATGISERFIRYNQGLGKTPLSKGSEYSMLPLDRESFAADILLFDRKPFEENSPRLAGRIRAGGWTSALNDDPAFPMDMFADIEQFVSPESGLGMKVRRHVGVRSTEVTHGLPNQFAVDISIVSLEPPSGFIADHITVYPDGGRHPSAIEMMLGATDPVTEIYYSANSLSQWELFVDPVGPIFTDSTYYFYGVRNGQQTPIQHVTYRFPSDPTQMDADGDGVPDFVEDYLGLNPITSGNDADRDGVSDLNEVLAGTDPNDDSSVPTELSLQDIAQRYRIHATPYAHSGVLYNQPYVPVPAYGLMRGPQAVISIHRPNGSLEASGVAQPPLFPAGQPARFLVDNHTIREVPEYLIVTTENRYPISIPDEDKMRGREVAALIPVPAPDLLDSGFVYNGELDVATNAASWIAMARAHHLAASHTDLEFSIDYETTLDLLLLEHCLGAILYQRGSIASPLLSMTPYRTDADPALTGEPLRHVFSDALLKSVAEGGHGDNGYDWHAVHAHVQASSLPSGQSKSGLQAVAREIYRIAAFPSDAASSPAASPLDALRRFIDSGQIDEDYADVWQLPERFMQSAIAYLDALLLALPTRNYTAVPLTLLVTELTLTTAFPLVWNDAEGQAYELADSSGNPLRLPESFRLLPGTRLTATGHLEAGDSGPRLLVDQLLLIDAPMPASEIRMGSLLPLSWEAFFFGRSGIDPFVDHDRDGYSTLQEFFEQADPRDRSAQPLVSVVDLSRPALNIAHVSPAAYRIAFAWSPAYQNRVEFSLQASDDLLGFAPLIPAHPSAPDGQFSFEHVPADPAKAFYRVKMQLR